IYNEVAGGHLKHADVIDTVDSPGGSVTGYNLEQRPVCICRSRPYPRDFLISSPDSRVKGCAIRGTSQGACLCSGVLNSEGNTVGDGSSGRHPDPSFKTVTLTRLNFHS